MTEAKYTPEEQAAWATRGQEYLARIDQEMEDWRTETANRMVAAARAGTGWAENKDVENAVARLTNLFWMRAIGEQVSDALIYNEMNNGPGSVSGDPTANPSGL